MEEHIAQLHELGAPAAAAALGVAVFLAQLAGSELLQFGQRDAALRLLIFLTVLEVGLQTSASTMTVHIAEFLISIMC